jgi:hypothetical protein
MSCRLGAIVLYCVLMVSQCCWFAFWICGGVGWLSWRILQFVSRGVQWSKWHHSPLQRKYAVHCQRCRDHQYQYPHIFLLAAVMSRDALIVRSRLSWCSSSSSRNCSNIGMYGDCGFDVSMFGALNASAALLLFPALDMLAVRGDLTMPNMKVLVDPSLGTDSGRHHCNRCKLNINNPFTSIVQFGRR